MLYTILKHKSYNVYKIKTTQQDHRLPTLTPDEKGGD